jgi:hypothetical protein
MLVSYQSFFIFPERPFPRRNATKEHKPEGKQMLVE